MDMRTIRRPKAARHGTALAMLLLGLGLLLGGGSARAQQGDVQRYVGAMIGQTPIIDDLRYLVDVIGGRETGTAANEQSVDWAIERFREAGVAAQAEPFPMPRRWIERRTAITIDGALAPKVKGIAKFFSAATGTQGVSGRLVPVGAGSKAELEAAGDIKGAWLLVTTRELVTFEDLLSEFGQAATVDDHARDNGAAGVAYISSRPRGVLYRSPASDFAANRLPIVLLDREDGLRLDRLARSGHALTLSAVIEVEEGGPYTARNVIAEIPGTDLKDEIVIIGAHLDSHGVGTGALDNGCNAMMMIDLARQIVTLGIKPRRTIRFALWNGEEQGVNGSWQYTVRHRAEMARHRMSLTIDIGSGRINGFFLMGRGREVQQPLDAMLRDVAALGPFEHLDKPEMGTDNFDFLLHGIPNLVAIQDADVYAPNYHATSDSFDKVDQGQLKRNAAIMGAVLLGFANADQALPRQSRAEVEKLVEESDLREGMKRFGVYDAWKVGRRGRVE